MSTRDWDIVDGVALRQVNGQQVVVAPGNFINLEAAIKDWEAGEALRQRQSVEELGRLVDAALDRMRETTGVNRGVRRGNTDSSISATALGT
ncbi:hypothetical protein AB0M44_22555 [Streptosporangium subroseum]|uniref:hypothetical protein n=1 Tax=Streptosporangium subroseum TaxID=106412 RepID=UPI00342B93E1